MTLILLAILGAIFLKGFKEAIEIAVVLVATYLVLNAIVTARAVVEVLHHPELDSALEELRSLRSIPIGSGSLAYACFFFRASHLGLSGFETGVAVMPLICRRGPRGAHPQYAETADHRSGNHERISDRHQLRDDRSDSAARI